MKITLKVKKEHKGHVSKYTWGFPGGQRVKTPPCSKYKGRFHPGRRSPHALQQQASATTTELTPLKPASRNS